MGVLSLSGMLTGKACALALTPLLVLTLVPGAAASKSQRPVGAEASINPIVRENAKPGTTSWRLVHPAWPDQLKLSGYAGAVSVNHGQSVNLYVTDDVGVEDLTFDVYRMGWYQGAGARLMKEISGAHRHFIP